MRLNLPLRRRHLEVAMEATTEATEVGTQIGSIIKAHQAMTRINGIRHRNHRQDRLLQMIRRTTAMETRTLTTASKWMVFMITGPSWQENC